MYYNLIIICDNHKLDKISLLVDFRSILVTNIIACLLTDDSTQGHLSPWSNGAKLPC